MIRSDKSRLGDLKIVVLLCAISAACLTIGFSLGTTICDTKSLQQFLKLNTRADLQSTTDLAIRSGIGLSIAAVLMLVSYVLLPTRRPRATAASTNLTHSDRKRMLSSAVVGGVFLLWCVASSVWPIFVTQVVGESTIENLARRTDGVNIVLGIVIYLLVTAGLIMLPVPLLRRILGRKAKKT